MSQTSLNTFKRSKLVSRCVFNVINDFARKHFLQFSKEMWLKNRISEWQTVICKQNFDFSQIISAKLTIYYFMWQTIYNIEKHVFSPILSVWTCLPTIIRPIYTSNLVLNSDMWHYQRDLNYQSHLNRHLVPLQDSTHISQIFIDFVLLTCCIHSQSAAEPPTPPSPDCLCQNS